MITVPARIVGIRPTVEITVPPAKYIRPVKAAFRVKFEEIARRAIDPSVPENVLAAISLFGTGAVSIFSSEGVIEVGGVDIDGNLLVTKESD